MSSSFTPLWLAPWASCFGALAAPVCKDIYFLSTPGQNGLHSSFHWFSTFNLNRMARNVEIKARAKNMDALNKAALVMATEAPINIQQDDTFFSCDRGRLKLRAFVDGSGQLIFYRRANESGPKESFYCLSQIANADTLRETLSMAYGQVGRVKKTRTLVIFNRIRIHLDVVEDLGNFIEVEVILEDHESTEIGVKEAENLMARLGIQATDLIGDAYVDLLAR